MDWSLIFAVAFVLGLPALMAYIARWAEEGRGFRTPRPAVDASPREALVVALVLWALLTVLGEIVAIKVNVYPVIASDKGEEIERAFRVLTIMAVPIFTMVVAVLVYTVLRRSYSDLPDEDGPALQGRGAFPVAWFGITAGLTALVMIYPGLTTLHVATGHEHHPDVPIKVEGMQWTWLVSYPGTGVENVREIVLPVNKTVTFEITSRDVLHSFWVPAFLMKVDAVPGLTSRMSLKATKRGDFDMDPTIRLQCAELCGLSHASMSIPVSVVSQQEFDSWLKEKLAAASGQAAGAEGGAGVTIVAKDLKFSLKDITTDAGKPLTVTLDNQDAGVQHNWALYEKKGGKKALVATNTRAGPAQVRVSFDLKKPGTYFFRCDVHPTQMTGTLIAK